jgi:hypothetical protein
MTNDELLALIGSALSHQPQAAAGGYLVCHTPHVAEFAYLGRVYDPVSAERARTWATRSHHLGNPYLSFVTDVANGLRIANLSLYGVVEQIDRATGPGVGQPISLDYGNVVERPTHLDASDMVIGAVVGWSSRGSYVMDRLGAVRLVHCSNGDDVAAEWPNLKGMLAAELTRIGKLHDPHGRELTTSTDLMHPKGQRWETEIEPGSARH